MNTHSDKSHKHRNRSVADTVAKKQSGGESTFQLVDNRPDAIQTQQLQVTGSKSPQVQQSRAFQERANDSPQARRTAQLQEIANQGHVIQATMVGGIDVTFSPGYASWDQADKQWHINWTLGDADVYHVTDESTNPKTHYYFTLNAGDIRDAVAPKGMKGRKGSSKKFSALPAAVGTYIRLNIDHLQTES